MVTKKIEITKHILVPKHSKVSEKEKKDIFEKYNVSMKSIPQISIKDPAIKGLNVKAGDIIKIERKSQTAGLTYFYRGVVNE